MIDRASIRHRGIRAFVERGVTRGLPASLAQRICARLAVLEEMAKIGDLPPTYNAHQLRGARRGTWSISVNGPWRLTFKFRKEAVFDLDLEQYH
jgi:proteic killer suppression protein